MISLVIAIFVASVLGSFHCAGMCGAFIAIAAGDSHAAWRKHTRLQGAYHIGRLVSYICLGAAAGSAGRLIDLAGALAGIRPVAAALAGATMIFFGFRALLRSGALHFGRFTPPQFWTRLVQRGHRFAFDRSPTPRAAMIGLFTTLLPCGWLYGFAITAAGTASPTKGMLAMAAFWAGTLPALVLVGAGLRRVLGPLGQKLPALTCIALVGAGLYTLAGRALVDPVAMAGRWQSSTTVSAMRKTSIPRAGEAPCCDLHDAHH